MDTIPTYIFDAIDRPVTVARCTEFVVVSFWQPDPSSSKGHYTYEVFPDIRDAERTYADYERGEWGNARAVCIFASRHGVPIGKVL